jgi:hypothetical protein
MKSLDLLSKQCNKYTNGQCGTLACLQRGGYNRKNPKLPIDLNMATCEYHEAILEILDLKRKIPQRLK